MKLSQFAKNYFSLGLRINKHIPGYVEHYYGPSIVKKKVDLEEKISPKKLLTDYYKLIKELPNQGYNQRRLNFLNKNLIAIEAILNKLNGKQLPYLDLVEKLFDFKPVQYEDDFFYELAAKADEVYQGKGSLSERMNNYANRRTIPKRKVKDNFIKTLIIAQQKTKELFPSLLPDKESVVVNERENQSWPLYCWYQGNFNSIIDINIDRIHYWTYLLYNVCHEGYPGHHTERSVREELLFRRKGYFESSILMIYTPEMVISEGIGVTAEVVIFDPIESAQILLNNLDHTNLKLDEDLDSLIKQNEIRKCFRKFESNLALHKYVDEWSESRIVKYIKSFEIIDDKVIPGILTFISDELWGPYMQTYQGERLITNKFGEKPSPLDFRRILTEQTLPSDLV
ncbi:MAG: hypothetical protein ACFFKA_13380 [Candidatus Thorarchaeota archaeon]